MRFCQEYRVGVRILHGCDGQLIINHDACSLYGDLLVLFVLCSSSSSMALTQGCTSRHRSIIQLAAH